jgi:hypothetical protein
VVFAANVLAFVEINVVLIDASGVFVKGFDRISDVNVVFVSDGAVIIVVSLGFEGSSGLSVAFPAFVGKGKGISNVVLTAFFASFDNGGSLDGDMLGEVDNETLGVVDGERLGEADGIDVVFAAFMPPVFIPPTGAFEGAVVDVPLTPIGTGELFIALETLVFPESLLLGFSLLEVTLLTILSELEVSMVEELYDVLQICVGLITRRTIRIWARHHHFVEMVCIFCFKVYGIGIEEDTCT